MARPSKLSAETQAKIIELIREGNFASVASRAAGVSPATFARWMQLGETQKSGRFRLFRDAIICARAQAQSAYVGVLRKAAESDWRAASFYLERTDPTRWGARRFVEQKTTNINLLDTNRRGISPAERAYGIQLREAFKALRESRDLHPEVSDWNRLSMTAEAFGVYYHDLQKLEEETVDAVLDAEVLELGDGSTSEEETDPPLT